jgi:hypothetical protein
MTAIFWSWVGWDALVALGTISLAFVTYLLGRNTRDVARETRQLGSETHKMMQASTKPLLADVPEGENPHPAEKIFLSWSMEGPQFEVTLADRGSVVVDRESEPYLGVSVPVRNVGVGAASVEQLRIGGLFDAEWNPLEETPFGRPSKVIVPPQEFLRLNFVLLGGFLSLGYSPGFYVEVTYRDVVDATQFRTRLDVRGDRTGSSFHITKVLLYHGDESEPYVTSLERNISPPIASVASE